MESRDLSTRGVGRTPLIIGVIGLLVGLVLVYHGASNLHSVDFLNDPARAQQPMYRLPVMTTLAGIFVGIGAPLFAVGLYTHRRLGVQDVEHRHQASFLGVVWGTASTVVAGGLESLTPGIPGFLGTTEGGYILASFIEEAAKLALPVLLLILVARYRRPILGVWTVFVASAVFGFIEGIGYVFSSLVPALTGQKLLSSVDEGIVFVINLISRANVELVHPFITTGAAVIIWLAVATRGSQAVWTGIGAWVAAGLLHALDDAVINTFVFAHHALLGSLLIFIYVWGIFFLWFRPQLGRLARHTQRELLG